MKTVNWRIQHKIGTTEDWLKAVNFTPLEGELIIYSDVNKIKIGDGETNVNDLEFLSSSEQEQIVHLGEGNNSLIANGHSNKAFGSNSSALGENTIAGGKGFRFDGAEWGQEEDSEKYLSLISFPYSNEDGLDGFYDESGWMIGDTFSISIDEHYHWDFCGAIEDIHYDADGIILIDCWIEDYGDQKLTDLPDLLSDDEFMSKYNPIIYVPNKPCGDCLVGSHAHAEGYRTIAANRYAHAEGNQNQAGYSAHAEGQSTMAKGLNSHSEGYKTKAIGVTSHAEGSQTQAIGKISHAEGYKTESSGNTSHAEGKQTTATGEASHSEGYGSSATGIYAHAEGYDTKAFGDHSHAEGRLAKAAGSESHAEGYNTEASGIRSHAEGRMTKAIGQASHAEGSTTEAHGSRSHAEGGNTKVYASDGHAEGTNTIAGTVNSTAKSQGAHVQGRWNIEDTEEKYAHIVGNGKSTNRSNAHTLDWSGNAWFAGDVESSEGKLASVAYVQNVLGGYATEGYVNEQIENIEIPNPDWNENNEDGNGYIKNRTHWKEIETTTIKNYERVNETQILNQGIAFDIKIIRGEEDGDLLYKNVRLYGERDYLDESSYVSGYIVPSIPDVEVEVNGDLTIVSTYGYDIELYAEITTSTSQTIYHKLDKNYLPDGLATEEYVDSQIENIEIPEIDLTGYATETYVDSRYITAGQSLDVNIGEKATAEGHNTQATGKYSHAEGQLAQATGDVSHAEGYNTTASGVRSHAEGRMTTASGEVSHAEGNATIASGARAHAEGFNTQALFTDTHSEGYYTTAGSESGGQGAHAEGMQTKATGKASHAEGRGTRASSEYQHAQGKYNIEDTSATYAHIVGNGTSDTARSNAHTLDWDGNAWFAGGVRIEENLSVQGNLTLFGNIMLPGYVSAESGIQVNDIDSYNGATIRINAVSGLCVTGENGDGDSLDVYTLDSNGNAWFAGSLTADGGLKSYVTAGQKAGTTLGQYATAEGYNTEATGQYSHAEGYKTTASGNHSHAESSGTTASGDYSHAEGNGTTASGDCSHAEGHNTTVSSISSHAEGESTTASGDYSHAEGFHTTASGDFSHAEGRNTTANGNNSHAEGYYTTASGSKSHAEGDGTHAIGNYSHAEGSGDINLYSVLLSGEVGTTTYTISDGSYIKVGRVINYGLRYATIKTYNKQTLTITVDRTLNPSEELNAIKARVYTCGAFGAQSHSEGRSTIAYGLRSHAEGDGTYAIGDYSHAEGSSTISLGSVQHVQGKYNVEDTEDKYAHIVGNGIGENSRSNAHTLDWKGNAWFAGDVESGSGKLATEIYVRSYGQKAGTELGGYATAEGLFTTASGDYSHAEGYNTTANYIGSHAEGSNTTASGDKSHAEGESTTASGSNSHTEGCNTLATNMCSHAEGYFTIASGAYQNAQGKYNVSDIVQYAHIIGNGTAEDARSNALTVSWKGNGVISGSWSSATGADYAEYFEWADGNLNDEDRVGYIVTLDGDKIRLANSEDEDILGIISGTAAIIGDTASWDWQDKYLTDEFGRTIWDMVEEFIEVEEEVETEDGSIEIQTVKKSVGFFPHRRLNPAYDESQIYVPRSERKEWDTVGMLGKLHVRDDGTCIPNGYVKVGYNGIATYSSTKTNMRVLKRITNNIVLVLLK